jgi:hypothetical protein
MLAAVNETLTERKARLFAVACCRRVWHLFTDGRSQAIIEIAERHADGLAGEDEWAGVGSARTALAEGGRLGHAVYWAAEPGIDPPFFAEKASLYARSVDCPWFEGLSPEEQQQAWEAGIPESANVPELNEHGAQSDLLRDIVENPFRAVALDRAWQTPTVAALARAAYAERSLPAGALDPGRIAVLADALEEAGCADADLLGRLRGPGPHVRGCWAVDRILGRN